MKIIHIKIYFLVATIFFFSCFTKYNFFIKLNKSGTIVGINEEFIVIDKNLIYKNKKTGITIKLKLSQDKIKLIKEISEKIEKKERESIGKVFPDCMIYEIVIKERGSFKKITYIPTFEIKEPDIDKLIDILHKCLNDKIE